MEQYGQDQCGLGFHTDIVNDGTSFNFDFDVTMRLILEMYGSDGFVTTGSGFGPVKVAFAMDGAKLTNNLGHVMARVKVIDERAVDPITKVPLAMTKRHQSRDL